MWIYGNLSGCIVRQTAILLDIDKDRYFALPDHANDVFVRCLTEGADAEFGSGRRLAIAPDALRLHANEVQHTSAEYAYMTAGNGRPALMNVCEALGRKASAAASVRGRTLSQNVAALRQLKASAQNTLTSPLSSAASILNGFRAAKTIWSDNDRCLAYSIAVFQALIRRRVRVELMIGVAIPFAAHCWVQHDNIVLTDSVDLVSRYEPILMI